MMFVDPRDKEANADWPSLYQAAWERRRELRIKRCEIDAQIAKLDTFVEQFEELEGKPQGDPGPTTFTFKT